MKQKPRYNKKQKKKRNKKYSGAAAQSKRDKEKSNNDYSQAANQLSSYNGSINQWAQTVATLNIPDYRGRFDTLFNLGNQLSGIVDVRALLPDIHSGSPGLTAARGVLNSISGISSVDYVRKFVQGTTVARVKNWYDQYMVNPMLRLNADYSKYLYNPNNPIIQIGGASDLLSLSIQSSLTQASELSLYAEKSLSSFPWKNFGSAIGLTGDLKNNLVNSFLSGTESYSSLLGGFNANPDLYVNLDPSLSKIIPKEHFASADFIESISTESEDATPRELQLKTEIQYENEITFAEFLPIIHSNLFRVWQGAIEALRSNNPDKARHFAVSMRELFREVMHRLAPNDAVHEWSTNPTTDFDDQGNPTRGGRIRYIFRNVSQAPLSEFAKQNIRTVLTFVDALQPETHLIESRLDEKQSLALRNYAETSLQLILKTEFTVNRQS